jgi:hypothetical protein
VSQLNERLTRDRASSFAASDILSFDHGGSKTTSTRASVTPSTALTFPPPAPAATALPDSRGRQRHPYADHGVAVDDDLVDQAEGVDVDCDFGLEG